MWKICQSKHIIRIFSVTLPYDTHTNLKYMKPTTWLAACLFASFFGTSQEAQAQDDYFVTTDNPAATQDSTGVENEVLTPEQCFVKENFTYRSLCDWTEGTRFMVYPSERETLLGLFADAETGRDVPTGTLRKHIVLYKGHEVTDRGYIHLNFEVADTQQRIYYEIRNIDFDAYCAKTTGGGVPGLVYLEDVDKAKELMMGQVYYANHETFYKDDRSTPKGYREQPIPLDTKLTVTAVGVGSREYPVKVVVMTDQGQKFFQLCALSHTNSGMDMKDFLNSRVEQHLFENAFCFTPKETEEKSRRSSNEDLAKSYLKNPHASVPSRGHSSAYVTEVSYAGLVSGMAAKGQTQDMVRMSKGTADKIWKQGGNTVWWYDDGTEITFNRKGVAIKVVNKPRR